ncbi:MAG: hypothetical protein ACOYMA_10305 [Bacteroidia bacterium]
MKKINKTKSHILILGLTCMISFFITCKNPTDDLAISIMPNYLSSPNLFYVYDASTGNTEDIMDNVSVKVTGPSAPYIYSLGGNKDFVINNGIIQLYFRNGTVASAENPLKFNLEINIPGYVPYNYSIIKKSINSSDENIYLINLSNLPKGVAKINASATTDQSGTTTSATTVTLPTNANKTEIAELTIPAGVTMKDKDGNPITGTVNIDVMQFTGGQEQSLNTFGSFKNKTIKDINGNLLNETNIGPLGWLNIEMTASGKNVKTFSSPVKAKVGIPAGLMNPITFSEYKEGDLISIFSWENDAALITKEATSTLQKSTDGSLYTEFNINHLSYWNFGMGLLECAPEITIIHKLSPDHALTTFGLADYTITYYKNNKIDVLFSKDYNINESGAVAFPSYSKVFLYPGGENFAPSKITSTIKTGNLFRYYINTPISDNLCKNTNQFSTTFQAPTLKYKFRGKCANKKNEFALVATTSKLFYIKNSVYLSNNSPRYSNKSLWKSVDVLRTTDKLDYFNYCYLDKSDFVGGGDYRFVLFDGMLWNSSSSSPNTRRTFEEIKSMPSVLPDELTFEFLFPCNF